MLDSFRSGLLLAALSAVFNGSFGLFTKINPGTRRVPPLVLNYWVCEGVGISGLLLLALPNRVFTWTGVLSGVLFVASAAHAVTAIALIGLSAATGVWCGTAVLVSFAYGVAMAGDKVESMGQAGLALALILAGIAGIVAATAGGASGGEEGFGESVPASVAQTPRGVQQPDGGAALEAAESLLPANSAATAAFHEGLEGRWHLQLRPAVRLALGLLAAVLAGAIGGLILAPMLAAPPEARGIQFVPSMAVGALTVAPLVTSFLTCWPSSGISFVQATSSRAAAPGMAAGATWQLGNIACIGAVTNPAVGYAISLPIMQCGLFVAGLWGILLFGEIRGGGWLTLYFASGAALIAGAALLAAAKGGDS